MIIKFFSNKNIFSFFSLGLILTIALMWPLFAAPYFSHHDDVQVIRLLEMHKCIKDFQIPCRWVPDLGGLYGYPIFNYYAPLPYYIGEIFYLLSGSFIFGAKTMFAIPLIASYIFMYLLAKKTWGKWGGVLSGLFYSYAPYHAVASYVRGAMGEMWALMFYPALFWAVLRLRDSRTLGNTLLLALFVTLLFLSHNLSTMLFLPITLFFIFILFLEKKDFQFLKFAISGVILGLLLSSFYWMPMLLEKNLVHVDSTISGYFSYTEHFKGLRKLFIERMWGWGASVREIPGGERDGMSFQIGWVHLAGWLLGLLSVVFLWRKNRQASILVLFASFFVFLSVFMINPKSEPVWKAIDPLKYIQFPWRFLMLVIFFISFLSGSILLWLKGRWQKVIGSLLILAVVIFNFSYFQPEKFYQVSDQELLTGKSWDKLIKRSIFDFLPIYAKAPPAELATSEYEIISGKADILNFKKGTNWINFQTEVTDNAVMRLSQYYFPNWKLTIDGKEQNIDYKNDLGLMTFNLTQGSHNVKLNLENTNSRTIGNFLTILGIIISMTLIFSRRKNRIK